MPSQSATTILKALSYVLPTIFMALSPNAAKTRCGRRALAQSRFRRDRFAARIHDVRADRGFGAVIGSDLDDARTLRAQRGDFVIRKAICNRNDGKHGGKSGSDIQIRSRNAAIGISPAADRDRRRKAGTAALAAIANCNGAFFAPSNIATEPSTASTATMSIGFAGQRSRLPIPEAR